MHRAESAVCGAPRVSPAHQRSKYQFRITGTGRERERPTLVIEFASVDRRSNPVLIKDPGGHDDCFD
jgi:hypothetical protein